MSRVPDKVGADGEQTVGSLQVRTMPAVCHHEMSSICRYRGELTNLFQRPILIVLTLNGQYRAANSGCFREQTQAMKFC